MHVVGLTGKLRAGKDTTFEIMQDEGAKVGLRVERLAFADYLKVSGAIALGGLGEDPTDLTPEGRRKLVEAANDFKDEGSICIISHRKDGSTFGANIDGRKFWQVYGTEAHREALDAPDFWIETLLKGRDLAQLEDDYEQVDVLVVTDVRFDNEANALRNLDFSGPKDGFPGPISTREKNVVIARVTRGEENEVTHVSEAGISDDLVDWEIDNSGDMDALRDQVGILLAMMALREAETA